jgi:hypothetical protein
MTTFFAGLNKERAKMVDERSNELRAEHRDVEHSNSSQEVERPTSEGGSTGSQATGPGVKRPAWFNSVPPKRIREKVEDPLLKRIRERIERSNELRRLTHEDSSELVGEPWFNQTEEKVCSHLSKLVGEPNRKGPVEKVCSQSSKLVGEHSTSQEQWPQSRTDKIFQSCLDIKRKEVERPTSQDGSTRWFSWTSPELRDPIGSTMRMCQNGLANPTERDLSQILNILCSNE